MGALVAVLGRGVAGVSTYVRAARAWQAPQPGSGVKVSSASGGWQLISQIKSLPLRLA